MSKIEGEPSIGSPLFVDAQRKCLLGALYLSTLAI